ncbi:MAG: lysophospholipid acyltransferase family protein [Chloroflexi bacterium]|nr:lysophospholipid acyltransferase family protein [Chloroflexota bacterium]
MAFLLHRFSNRALRTTLALFSDYRAEGGENIPADGPLIVVANHQSNMDPPILAMALRRDTKFLAKEGIFHKSTPLGRWFLTSYGAKPLRRDQMDIAALRWAMEELKRPRATLAIFPEGTRNPGAMKLAKPGIVALAARTGVPILPVGLAGVEVMGSWARVFKPKGTIRVHIGPPFRLNVAGKLSRIETEAAMLEIMGRVAALLPQSYRGYYEDAANGPFSLTTTIEPAEGRPVESASAGRRADNR